MSQQSATRPRPEVAEPDLTVRDPPALIALPTADPVPAGALIPMSLESCPPDSLVSSESVVRRALAAADVAVLAAVLLLILRQFGVHVGLFVVVASLPMVVLIFKIAGLYNRDELRLSHSTLDEAPQLLQLTGLYALAVAILHAFLARGLNGAQIAALWLASFVAVVGGRVVARSVARHILPLERCLIVGEANEADRIRAKITVSRVRTRVVHCLAGDELRRTGGAETILRLVHDLGVHRIIIAPIAGGTDRVVEMIRIAKAVGVRVTVLRGILEVVGSGVAFDEVEGLAMLGVPHFGLSRSSWLLKRTVDLICTTIGLVVISPVLGAIALAIRVDSKGPVFFRQTRVGLKGQHFAMIKFRSMVADADARKDDLRLLNVAGAGLFKVKDDPRVTRVGRFLRRSSLDELPQLFNVIRGDMSLVGPRPLVIDEDAQVLGLDRSRLRLKPGMTGPWQLLGSRVPLNEMVEIDYLYASQWSLWLDLKLLLKTARHVLSRGNL